MAILGVRDLTVTFGGIQALVGVDISIDYGEIHGLIGPNGAGKSTLFNAVVGAVRPSDGHVFFQDNEITGLTPPEAARAGIARTFQNLKLFNDMTVIDNVIVGGLCRAKTRFWGSLFSAKKTVSEDRSIREKAESILSSLGLLELKEKVITGLPYGQRKAIELARALATDPKILLLDEPRTGMNIEETETIIEILRKIRDQGYTIFLIEHDMRMVMQLSDRITVLNFGKKIAEGTPKNIANDERVIKAYLGH